MKQIVKNLTIAVALTVMVTTSFAQPSATADGSKKLDRQAGALVSRQPDPIGGPLPGKVVDQLGLTAEQQNMMAGALAARQEAQAANMATRDTSYKMLTDQLSSDKFDPRAVIKQREQARNAMDARVDTVQQKWLLFWDSLSQTQRNTLVQYMREQHAAMAKQRNK